MHIFIDHNLPYIYARVLDAFLEIESGGQDPSAALMDMFTPEISDGEWMQDLANRQDEKWCFFTADTAIRRTREERQIWLQSELKGFFLKQSFLKQPIEIQFSKIFKLLPEIRNVVDEQSKHQNFEIPAQGNRLNRISQQ